MPFDMIGALKLATRAPVAKSTIKTSNPRALAGPSASYSAEAVPLPTPDTSGPENRLQELAEYNSHEALEQRIKDAMQRRKDMLEYAASLDPISRLEQFGTRSKNIYGKKPKQYKSQAEADMEAHERRLQDARAKAKHDAMVPECVRNYERNLAEFELLKQECPWHAVKWPILMCSNGKSVQFSSMADPNYRGTDTAFLEYAKVYLAQDQAEYRTIMPVWIAQAKERLGILEIKEKQAAVRTEILIEGRADGLKSMHALAGTRKKNCTGAELNELCTVTNMQPLGMFPLSTKQMQMAEQRNLLTYPMPMHDALQYCCINWLLFDMPRYTAFKELSRSLGRGDRSYTDDNGDRRLIRNGALTKEMPGNLTSKE